MNRRAGGMRAVRVMGRYRAPDAVEVRTASVQDGRRAASSLDSSRDRLDVLLSALVIEILDAPFCSCPPLVSPVCVSDLDRRVAPMSSGLSLHWHPSGRHGFTAPGRAAGSSVGSGWHNEKKIRGRGLRTWNCILLKLFGEPWRACQSIVLFMIFNTIANGEERRRSSLTS